MSGQTGPRKLVAGATIPALLGEYDGVSTRMADSLGFPTVHAVEKPVGGYAERVA